MLDRFFPQIFLGAAQRNLFEKGLPVFTYHYIGTPPSGADPFLYVSPERFDAQLLAMRGAGYTSVSLSDFSPAVSGPSRGIVITFDDGARNVCDLGLEILARHRFQAIQFIVSDYIGQRNEWDAKHGNVEVPLMDDSQIRDWLAAGHRIGSHSATHRNLLKLNREEAREQIAGSKKKLEDRFGVPVEHFCYPHGRWNAMTRELAGEAGYLTACTTEFGVNTPDTPPYSLKRIFPLSAAEWIHKIQDRLLKKIK